MKYYLALAIAVSVCSGADKLVFESSGMMSWTGFEFSLTGNQIDSIRFWNGPTMHSLPDTELIMGGVPSRKTLSDKKTLWKWQHTKEEFERALERIRVTGFYDINDQSTLMDDGLKIEDGWHIVYKQVINGKVKKISYHCPNMHMRREDQIVARVWDILKEADPSLYGHKTTSDAYSEPKEKWEW